MHNEAIDTPEGRVWERVAFNLCAEFGPDYAADKQDFARAVVREYLAASGAYRATPMKGQISDLVKALSRLADNRHSDGVSSLVSSEDRGAIINGCYDLMIAARQSDLSRQAELGGGVAAIAAERRRQVEAEDWTPEHDDGHAGGEMAVAAACYATEAAAHDHDRDPSNPPENWPWHRKWWKSTERRRDLVKAGALIAAEIDRLDRADTSEKPEAAHG